MTEAYRLQLEALEKVLRGCNPGSNCARRRADARISLRYSLLAWAGKGDHLVELRTPLGTASTMAEDLLLEYTDGMDAANVGWGRVDIRKLRELLQLHTASEDISQRTGYIARVQSSNLLFARSSVDEAGGWRASEAGALGKPGDRVLILVGHDTNLANISGALGLNWLMDGRRDDTPPGGALVFELWKKRGAEEYSVRTFYTAQTLDQMRNATPLSLGNPPDRVAVFVPGCSRADQSCAWSDFKAAIQAGINPAFTKK